MIKIIGENKNASIVMYWDNILLYHNDSKWYNIILYVFNLLNRYLFHADLKEDYFHTKKTLFSL